VSASGTQIASCISSKKRA